MKKLIQRFFILSIFILAFVSIFSFSILSQAAGKTVRVGYYLVDSFQEVNEYGEYSGYGFELLYEITQYTGWHLEYVIAPFSECEEMLKRGEIDLIQGISYSPSKANYMDFSEKPCSTVRSELYVMADNTQYTYEDFDTFDGMTVGIMKGNSQVQLLYDYCKNNNFTVALVEYPTQSDLENALQAGEVDSVFSSNISNVINNKIIARFPETPIYFAVRKGAEDILQELNQAVDDISINNPFFMTQLGFRYMMNGQTNNPAFTRDELDFIEENNVVNCIYDPDWAPIEYPDKETGAISGINADIFQLISKHTGLTFEFQAADSFTDGLDKIQTLSADLISCIYHDYNWAVKNNLFISSPYLKFPVVMVTRTTSIIEKPSIIALTKNHYTSQQIVRMFPDSTFIYYDSIQECFESVRTGKADATYTNIYVADNLLSDYKFYNLSTLILTNFQEELSIGIARNTDPRLLSIINKALSCITDEEINSIIYKHTLNVHPLTIRDLIYANPIEIIGTLVVIFFLAIVVFIYIILLKESTNKKTKKYLLQSRLDNQRFSLAMKHVMCQVFEYDMNENTITILSDSNSIESLFLMPGVHSISETNHILSEFVNIYFELFHKIELGEVSCEGNIQAANTNGDIRWYQISLSSLLDNDGESLQAIGTIEDVTEQKQKTEYDFLTGLYTRGNAEKYISAQLRQTAIYNEAHKVADALLLLDLDHFKAVNDTYGHMEGDNLLKTIGSILSQSVQVSDIVGRLGGDEFIIYLQNLSDERDACNKADEICNNIISLSKKKPEWSKITVSIGIAFAPKDGQTFEELYANADKALYFSKEHGRNQYARYEDKKHRA